MKQANMKSKYREKERKENYRYSSHNCPDWLQATRGRQGCHCLENIFLERERDVISAVSVNIHLYLSILSFSRGCGEYNVRKRQDGWIERGVGSIQAGAQSPYFGLLYMIIESFIFLVMACCLDQKLIFQVLIIFKLNSVYTKSLQKCFGIFTLGGFIYVFWGMQRGEKGMYQTAHPRVCVCVRACVFVRACV